MHFRNTNSFQSLKGTYKKHGQGVLARAGRDWPRRNGFKLTKDRFKSDIRKKFLTVR